MFYCLLLILIPIIIYLVIKALNSIIPFKKSYINPIVSFTVLAIATAMGILAHPANLGNEFNYSTAFFSINLWSDSFRNLMVVFLSAAMLFCGFVETISKKEELIISIERYFLLSASFMIVFSANFFTTIIGITLMTLSIIHLGAINSRDRILGIINFYMRKEISDFFLIVGVLVLALFGKTFDYIDLGDGISGLNNRLGNMALVFIVLWFLIRLRVFPFISLKQGFIDSIKAPLKAIFLSVYLPALITPFLNFTCLLDESLYSQSILFTLGGLTALCYGVMALFTLRLKEQAIYLTYAQYGLVIVGISVGAYSDVGIYVLVLTMILVTWYSIVEMLSREGIRTINDLVRLGRRFQKFKILMGTILFMMAGVPMLGIAGQRLEIIWSVANSSLGILGAVFVLAINAITLLAIGRVFALVICKRVSNILTERVYRNWELFFVGLMLFIAFLLSLLTIPSTIIPGINNIFISMFKNEFVETRIFFQTDTMNYVLISLDQFFAVSIFIATFVATIKNKMSLLDTLSKKVDAFVAAYRRYCTYSETGLKKTSAGMQIISQRLYNIIDEKIFSVITNPIEEAVLATSKLNKWSLKSFDQYVSLLIAGIIFFASIVGLTILFEGM